MFLHVRSDCDIDHRTARKRGLIIRVTHREGGPVTVIRCDSIWKDGTYFPLRNWACDPPAHGRNALLIYL